MDLLTTLRVLLRRWYLVLPVALVGLLLAGVVYVRMTPNYEAIGSALLRNPIGVNQELASQNAYLGYGTLAVAGRVASDVVSTQAYRQQLEEQGFQADYELFLDTSTAAPLIFSKVTAPTEQAAIESVTRTLAEVDLVLRGRQEAAGAPEATWITTDVVSEPEATPVNGSRIRAAGSFVVVGGLLALVLAFGVEALSRRAEKPSVKAAEPASQIPCSLCGTWLLRHGLIEHLQVAHGLTTQGSQTSAGIETTQRSNGAVTKGPAPTAADADSRSTPTSLGISDTTTTIAPTPKALDTSTDEPSSPQPAKQAQPSPTHAATRSADHGRGGDDDGNSDISRPSPTDRTTPDGGKSPMAERHF
jgi:hypothetical protein